MLFGSDWLANFYLGCFLFGLIFTLASLLLSAGHFGGHVHSGDTGVHGAGHGHIHAPDAHHGDDGIGWLNLPTVLAFITWFGAAGYLLHVSAGLPGVISGFGAILIGLIGGAIMFTLLARVLWPGQGKPLSRAEYQLRGTPGRVVSRINAGGTGEIVYLKGGVRQTIGARSETGQALELGTHVVVVRYERGLAYVMNVDAALGTNTGFELPPERPTLPLRDTSPPAEKARS